MPSAPKLFNLCLLAAILILLECVTQVDASVRRYRLEVTRSPYTRLCTEKQMLIVNGQSPGPTIYARRGDLVVVDIINNGDYNITIHWHGVKMPRYPWSDGTEFVTQCPIAPGTSFTQWMILSDEEGTLWWHAHSDWSRNSVYGAIVILPPKKKGYPFPKPHAHVPILLGEWWNINVEDVLNGFLASGRDPQVSDGLLINGQPGDLFPCSAQDMLKLRVEFGKTYLLKLVNGVMDNIMFFKIAGHNLTVVGTDGAYTKPMKTDYVAISPGQTIDFLLEANQPPSQYYMAARVHATGGDYVTTPTTGIIEYVGNYTPPTPPPLPSLPAITDSNASNRFTNRLRSLAGDVPKNVQKKLFFTVSMNHLPCNTSLCKLSVRTVSSVSNVSMLLPTDTNILEAYYRGINGVYTTDFPDFPSAPYDYAHVKLNPDESRPQLGTAASVLEYNTTVEIVFQGTHTVGGVAHPMHMHGYSFYVVGSGDGNFDGTRDPANYNLVDPPLVENIVVPKDGWTAIRFKASNPGVWFMHCHFERHLTWGMKMVFVVKDGKAPNEKMLPPPPNMPRCGQVLSSDSLQFAIIEKSSKSVESNV